MLIILIQTYEIANPAEAQAVAALGVDHLGVLVGSGRFPRELDFDLAERSLPESKGIALSLAPTIKEIIEVAEKTKPDILHIWTVPGNIIETDIVDMDHDASLKFRVDI